MPGKVSVWLKGPGGEPLPARESSAAGGPSAARMRQAASKKDDLMAVIADLGLVVWCFITLIFLFLFWFLVSVGSLVQTDAGARAARNRNFFRGLACLLQF